MKKHLLFIITALVMLSSLTSCAALKKFFSKDVEDEDYIISQLYADEYVDEKAYVPVKSKKKSGSGSNSTAAPTGKLGIEITSSDNKKLYAAIEDWYGTPYLYGGCTKSGVDCSCFVGNVYKSVYGITLKRVAHEIYESSTVVAKSNLKEGDFVFFTNNNKRVSHVGIYLKDGMFAHSSTSRGVMISHLDNSYWKQHFFKGGRIKH